MELFDKFIICTIVLLLGSIIITSYYYNLENGDLEIIEKEVKMSKALNNPDVIEQSPSVLMNMPIIRRNKNGKLNYISRKNAMIRAYAE